MSGGSGGMSGRLITKWCLTAPSHKRMANTFLQFSEILIFNLLKTSQHRNFTASHIVKCPFKRRFVHQKMAPANEEPGARRHFQQLKPPTFSEVVAGTHSSKDFNSVLSRYYDIEDGYQRAAAEQVFKKHIS